MAAPAQTSSAAPFDSFSQNEAKPISLSRQAIIWIVVVACMVIAAFIAVTVLLCRDRRKGKNASRGYSVNDGRNNYKAWNPNGPLPAPPVHDLPLVPRYGGYDEPTPLSKAAVRPTGSAIMEPMIVEDAGEGSGFQRKARGAAGGRYYSAWTGRISSRGGGRNNRTMVDTSESGAQPTWKFTQCFGDKGDVEDITEADIISTVEFDQTGNYLATGDKGGRVVLFERNETKKTCEYKFHTEFQSHEPEFDYLKSLEIEEKINKIKWCRRQNASHYLLSTNDKTIKLWKVFEKSLKVVAENNLSSELTPGGAIGANGGGPARYPHQHFRSAADLKFPRMTHHDTVVAAVPRRVYANAHAYHINSISVNSDGETFISSDDLRINLWNLNIQDQSFNIVDIKPANMEELTEVITAAEFHPTSCNWFMYASSKGTIKLADMRQKALCDEHAKQFEQEEDPSSRSFFSEIISSISDVRFSHDGRYILSRDYLTVKIWDVNMERQPVKTIPIHEHLRPRLCDTYENDSIFDKFEVVFSGDAKNVMTGSYNNNFMIYPSEEGKDTEVVLQADKSAFKAKKVGIPTPMNAGTSPGAKDGKKSRGSSPAGGAQRMRKETDADQIDFNKKILHMSWHPQEDSIAIAATNNLFVFSAL
ncbi:Protein phosphatase PP2A regulatory subunit B [Cryoendolithus antarcticus]|uniref:Protein phosphatase PP2A regulatory subunit B n=1 Tax=Cryoendolithus antarcticus TaxID=1507870 RepID=A0A1V8SYE2_9PEZI|nr:Protein phosphatase PP2A regulatory subunit B [Cryoendolithus antarcticus]